MKKKLLTVPLLIFIGFLMVWSCKHEPVEMPMARSCDPDTVYFEKDLLPLLQSSCAQPGCHDAISMQDGVRLTDYTSVIETGNVNPFDPEGSDIYEVLVETDPAKRMPPGGPWPQENIDLMYEWISQGAQNLFCDDGQLQLIVNP